MSSTHSHSGDSCSFALSLWLVLAQILYSYFQGFWTMYYRRKNVNVEVLKQKLGEEHKKHGIQPAMMGYPDMGSGKYGSVLPYQNWFEWNSAMRAHQDSAELVVVSVVATLGNLYSCPCTAALVGTLLLGARVLHTVACMKAPSMIKLAGNLNLMAIGSSLAIALIRTF